MKVMVIYGNPKAGGFIHGCLDRIAARLRENGAEVDCLHLHEADIRECAGCFHCLAKGVCPTADDMPGIIERIRQADGLVVGASVRNGLCPALYKRFYERITYLLGFTRAFDGKYVLGIGSVGFAGGKAVMRRLLTLKEYGATSTGFLFHRTGIPSRLRPEDVAAQLDCAADNLRQAIATKAPKPLLDRLSLALDNWVMKTFMFQRDKQHTYDHVVAEWKKKGWM